MRRGTIYKNLWAGYETYFILETVSTSEIRNPCAYGYILVFYKDKWNLRKATVGKNSLEDEEFFPIIGHVDIDKILISGFLKVIWKGSESDA